MGSRSTVLHDAFVNARSFLLGAHSADGVHLEADILEHSVNGLQRL